jgi:enoyl-CoA hydratase
VRATLDEPLGQPEPDASRRSGDDHALSPEIHLPSVVVVTVHVEEVGAAFTLTLDRPERRNAVDHATLDELAAGVRRAVDAGARAIVLTGAGGHFCAGADLTTLEDAGFASVLREVLDLFSSVPIATIAAVDGAALGAGTQLAISCDLRVATPTARFGIPAAKLGLMVDAATVQRLVALAGASTARAMLLAAETIDGSAAERIGFVHRLGGLDVAQAWAADIAALAPLTIAGHKLALERLAPPPEADPVIAEAFQRAWRSDDVHEGRRAFHERRPPAFQGR